MLALNNIFFRHIIFEKTATSNFKICPKCRNKNLTLKTTNEDYAYKTSIALVGSTICLNVRCSYRSLRINL